MTRRLASVLAAAATLAGTVAVVVPQHAASLVALAGGTVVVVLAVFLLVLAGPLATAEQPRSALDGHAVTGAPSLDPQGLRDARRDLAGRSAGSLPPAVRERLLVASELHLHRLGIDVHDAGAHGGAPLHPATWTLLTTPPPPGHVVDPERCAATVHRTLDELDALTGGLHDHHR